MEYFQEFPGQFYWQTDSFQDRPPDFGGSFFGSLSEFEPIDFDAPVTFRTLDVPFTPVPAQSWHFEALGSDNDCVSLGADLVAQSKYKTELECLASESLVMPKVDIDFMTKEVLDVYIPNDKSIAPTGRVHGDHLVEQIITLSYHTAAIDLLIEAYGESKGDVEGSKLCISHVDPVVTTLAKFMADNGSMLDEAKFGSTCKNLSLSDAGQLEFKLENTYNSDGDFWPCLAPHMYAQARRPGGCKFGDTLLSRFIKYPVDTPTSHMRVHELRDMYLAYASHLFGATGGYRLRSDARMRTRQEFEAYISGCLQRAFTNDCFEKLDFALSQPASDSGSGWDSVDGKDVSRFFCGHFYPGYPTTFRSRGASVKGSYSSIAFWSSCGDLMFSMMFDLARFICIRELNRKYGRCHGNLPDNARDFFVSLGKVKGSLGIYTPGQNKEGSAYVLYCKFTNVFSELGMDYKHVVDYAQASNPSFIMVYVDRKRDSFKKIDLPTLHGAYLYVSLIGHKYNKSMHLLAALRRLAYLHRSVLLFGECKPPSRYEEKQIFKICKRGGNFW